MIRLQQISCFASFFFSFPKIQFQNWVGHAHPISAINIVHLKLKKKIQSERDIYIYIIKYELSLYFWYTSMCSSLELLRLSLIRHDMMNKFIAPQISSPLPCMNSIASLTEQRDNVNRFRSNSLNIGGQE